jgi:hypothetical protein
LFYGTEIIFPKIVHFHEQFGPISVTVYAEQQIIIVNYPWQFRAHIIKQFYKSHPNTYKNFNLMI